MHTLRPIHNQILQIARLRVCQVARHLRLTLFGWVPKYACQVRTDALLCAFPKRLAPEIKKLRELPLRALGVDSDAPALRVSFAEPRWMKHCSNIRQDFPRPEIAQHTLVQEIPEDEDFVLTGCGGSGKSTAMREFAARLKAKGKQVYVISFQNSVAAKSNGQTCLLYTSPSPRDATLSRMPSSA